MNNRRQHFRSFLLIIFSFSLFSFLTAQTTSTPKFFEGFWVDFNELQRLRHDATWQEFPFNNDLLFFESIQKDQKNLIRREFDYDYVSYDLVAKGEEWETQPCIFNTKNCGGSIKFDIINNDTLAIVNYPAKNYPLSGIKVFTKIPYCKDLSLFDEWVFISEFFMGKFEVNSFDDQPAFEVEFKEDLSVTGFKNYNKYKLNLRNSEAIIQLYDEKDFSATCDYFIFDKLMDALLFSEIKDLETFKKVSQHERIVKMGKSIWKLKKIEK